MTSQPPTMIVKSPRLASAACAPSAGSQLVILLSATSLVAALVLSWAQLSQASPSPLSVQSKPPQQQQLEAAPPAEPASSVNSHPHDPQSVAQQELAAGSTNSAKPTTRPQHNVEKLKRGLTNFINQMNAAPFFVPQQQPAGADGDGSSGGALLEGPAKSGKSGKSGGGGGGLQSAAEPTALVNGDPTADVLIKGPNRLTQTRPFGGPLRWGRR